MTETCALVESVSRRVVGIDDPEERLHESYSRATAVVPLARLVSNLVATASGVGSNRLTKNALISAAATEAEMSTREDPAPSMLTPARYHTAKPRQLPV